MELTTVPRVEIHPLASSNRAIPWDETDCEFACVARATKANGKQGYAMSLQEIGDELGLKPGTIGVILRVAIRKLRAEHGRP